MLMSPASSPSPVGAAGALPSPVTDASGAPALAAAATVAPLLFPVVVVLAWLSLPAAAGAPFEADADADGADVLSFSPNPPSREARSFPAAVADAELLPFADCAAACAASSLVIQPVLLICNAVAVVRARQKKVDQRQELDSGIC